MRYYFISNYIFLRPYSFGIAFARILNKSFETQNILVALIVMFYVGVSFSAVSVLIGFP